MKAILFLFVILGTHAAAQSKEFIFYGKSFELPGYSVVEKDSLLNEKGVPQRIKLYLDDKIRTISLENWGLIYFLNAFVDAQFDRQTGVEKAKILKSLLSEERINNAIGIVSRSQWLSLVSVDNKAKLVNTPYVSQDGYKFVAVKNEFIPHLRKLDIVARAEYKDVDLNYSSAPNFYDLMAEQKMVYFFNYFLQSTDSLTFKFSKTYNDFFNDLPRIKPDYHYYKAPVSSIFRTSIFQEIDKKINRCKTRTDSINFLIKFIQTAVQFEEDMVVYGKEDFCSFPENTMAIGKGDCEDKCEAFAFLINHYFPAIDIVFLFYPGHVRIGLGNTNLSNIGKPFQEFEGKKYMEVELQSNDTVLADESFSEFHQIPMSIGR